MNELKAYLRLWKGNILLLKELFGLRYIPNRFLALVFVLVGVPATIGYHYYERSLGFWSNAYLRYGCVLFLVGIPICYRYIQSQMVRLVYWETTLLIFFPMASTHLMLMNSTNKYWYSTYILGMLFLGFCTKYYLIPFHYLFGAGIVTYFHQRFYHFPADVYSDAFQAQMASVLACIVGNGVIVVLEYAHKKAKQAGEEKLRAETAEDREKALQASMDQLQVAMDEIKKREECIFRFVSPTIVEELRCGKNPLEFQPELREMAIMFCDIREFTQLTENQSFIGKFEYLNSYFSKMTSPMVTNKGVVDKIMGDALMGIFNGGAAAVQAAVEMRMALHEYNREMIKDDRIKIRNGIGISKGVVTYGNFGSIDKLDRTVIGEAVNIASRLESKTKMYSLEIVVTEEVIKDLRGDFHYRWIDNVQVKGSSRHLKLFEVYDHQPAEVIKFKDATKAIMEKALTIYFQKSFHGALRLFQSLKERAPSHLYEEGEVMDSLMDYYIQRCQDWISSPNAWELIEKWEGFHVFQEK